MVNYYVIRNKETGFYFRGKGANRWGQYHNQASVYRMKAHAENTLGWLLRHGEPAQIVPIQIVENPTDIVKVVRCKDCKWYEIAPIDNVPYCCHESGYCGEYMSGLFYCANGERKDNGED